MKTTELAMRAYESGRPQAAITFGNEWITIRVKFPQSQTTEVRYPAELAPNKNKYISYVDHLVECDHYWFVMANSITPEMQDTSEHALRKIMCSRAYIILKRVTEYTKYSTICFSKYNKEHQQIMEQE